MDALGDVFGEQFESLAQFVGVISSRSGNHQLEFGDFLCGNCEGFDEVAIVLAFLDCSDGDDKWRITEIGQRRRSKA